MENFEDGILRFHKITVKLQTCRCEFKNLFMKNNDFVQNYLSRVFAFVNQMRSYGELITNEIVVAKILRTHEERLTRTHEMNKEKAFQINGESSQKCKAEYSMGKTQGKGGFHGRGRGRGRSRGPHSENKQHKSSI
ncbi:hypothetical protein QQP08_016681 [Theobroma cacao]|nr:hypothetical protein QQP08_016681 [Theobroma cacao]